MKVPEAQQQVGYDTPQVPTPQFARPTPDTFGANVAEATARGGQQIQQIGEGLQNHIIQMNLWREQSDLYNAREDFRNKLEDSLYNTGTQTVKDAQGNEHQVPVGIANRTGFTAQGATAEFTKSAEGMKADYLKQFNNPRVQRQAARMFDGMVSGYRGQVARHEAQQIQEGTAATFLSATMNETKAAGNSTDPETLQNSIQGVKDSYMRYGAFKGMDPETINKNTSQWTMKAISNAVMHTLSSTTDPDKAKALLDSVKDELEPNDYDNISKNIDTGAINLQKQATRINDLTQNKNALDLFSGIATKGVDWKDLGDIDTLNVPEEVKMAVKTALNAKLPANVSTKSLGTVDPKYKQFASHMADILGGEDQNQVVKTMATALTNFGHGKTSQEEYNILAKLAVMRGNSLPCSEDAKDGKTIDPKQVPIDAGAKSLMQFSQQSGLDGSSMFGHYVDAVQKGIDPKTAADDAKRIEVMKQYPQTVGMDEPPNMVLSPDGNIKAVFPESVTTYPSRIWNGKAFEVNKDLQKSSKDKP